MLKPRDGWEGDENLLLTDEDGNLYRLVPEEYSPKWADRWGRGAIKKFLASSFFRKAFQTGHIPKHTPITGVSFPYLPHGTVYSVETIPLCVAPWEWTNYQLADMAKFLLTFGMELEAAPENLMLSDFNSDNFTFNNTKPVLLDVGVVSNRTDDAFQILHQYTISLLNQFGFFKDNPIAPFDEETTPKEVVQQLLSFLSGPPKEPLGEWDAYYGCGVNSFKDVSRSLLEGRGEHGKESHWHMKHLRGCRTLADVGGLLGYFSWPFVLSDGVAVVIDVTPKGLANGYEIAKTFGLRMSFAKVDITKEPVASVKWGNWVTRFRSDAVMASSVTHHLYREGMSFDRQANLFTMLARKKVLAEFVEKTDVSPIRDWGFPESYNEAAFQNAYTSRGWHLSDRFHHSPTRTWMVFEK